MATQHFSGKDAFLLSDGSTYHLGAKKGDIFPRILTVGSEDRAKRIADHFDDGCDVKICHSSRNMHVYSGYFKGIGVSIIAIGMGAPMMDFMMREASQCYDGPLAVIRLGTCGIFNPVVPPGTIMCAGKGSMYVYVNYAHQSGCWNDDRVGKASPPYLITNPVECDKALNEDLIKQLNALGCPTHDGLNACGETFYACQGRKDPNYNDGNDFVIEELKRAEVDFVEMETHQLFHLARLRKQSCKVAGCAIGIVSRTNDDTTLNISEEKLIEMERLGGKACLETLVKTDI